MATRISNDMLAILLIIVMIISVGGTLLVMSKQAAPEQAPSTTGQVKLHVPEGPIKEGEVSLVVVSKTT